MKSHSKRIRALRRLALTASLAALAAPSAASAMLPNDTGFRHENQQQSQQYTPPSNFRTEVQTPAQSPVKHAFVLSRSYSPEVQTQAPAQSPVTHAIALRRSYSPEAPATATPGPTVIRQIETVSDDSGRTLAIVLSAIALAVALGSLGYAAIRMTRMQRRDLGPH